MAATPRDADDLIDFALGAHRPGAAGSRTVTKPASKQRRRNPPKRNVVVDASGDTQIVQPNGYKRQRRALPQKFLIIERRRRAYQLRYGGYALVDIGKQLHADPKVQPQGVATEGGYGWQLYKRGKPPLLGDGLRHAVSCDIRNGLLQAARHEALAREGYVQLEVDGLNAAQAAIWPRVVAGDVWAIDRYINLSARRSKILGLDVERVESTADVRVTVDGAQPDYADPAFTAKMFEALTQVGAIRGELPETTGDANIVDAVIVEQRATDGDSASIAAR